MNKNLKIILKGFLYVVACVLFAILLPWMISLLDPFNFVRGNFFARTNFIIIQTFLYLTHFLFSFVISVLFSHQHIISLFRKFSIKEIKVNVFKIIIAFLFLIPSMPLLGFFNWMTISGFLHHTFGFFRYAHEPMIRTVLIYLFWFNFIFAFSRKSSTKSLPHEI